VKNSPTPIMENGQDLLRGTFQKVLVILSSGRILPSSYISTVRVHPSLTLKIAAPSHINMDKCVLGQ
jgi:hypothetical protein